MSSGSEQATTATLLEFVKRLAEASVLLGAILFLIGWSYLYGYYRAFGISADDLGVSVDNVLMHSVPVIIRTAFWLTVLAGIVLIWVVSRLPLVARWLRLPAILLLLAMTGALSVSRYASAVGRDNAGRDAYVPTSTLPYVSFDGASNATGAGCSLEEANYRLLLRSNGWVFVILPIDSPKRPSAANLRICSFAESEIRAMRIQVAWPGR